MLNDAALADTLNGDTIAAGAVLWVCLVAVTFTPSKERP